MLHLGDLGLLEGRVGGREIGAGVDHLPVEPEGVEVVAEIVVMVRVGTRAAARVAAPEHPAPPPPEPCQPVAPLGPEDGVQHLLQVTVDLDPPVRVGVAEVELGRRPEEPEQRPGVGDPHVLARDRQVTRVAHRLRPEADAVRRAPDVTRIERAVPVRIGDRELRRDAGPAHERLRQRHACTTRDERRRAVHLAAMSARDESSRAESRQHAVADHDHPPQAAGRAIRATDAQRDRERGDHECTELALSHAP